MTIANQDSKILYETDGVSVSFAVPFRFTNALHLRVIEARDDVETILNPNSGNYSVTGVNSPQGGAVIFTSAPAVGAKLIIQRIVPMTQETHYPRNDPFPASAHEHALDKLTMITQQLAEQLSRAVLLSVSDAKSPQIFIEDFFQSVEDALNAAMAAGNYANEAAGSKVSAQAAATEAELSNQLAKLEADRAKAEADRAAAAASLATTKASIATEQANNAVNAASNAVAAKNEAIAAKDEAIAAKNEAIAAKDEAVAAKDEAVAAKDDAQLSADAAWDKSIEAHDASAQAQTAKDAAEAAKESAETAKTEAQTAKNAAETAADDAEQAKDEAQAILDEIKALKEEMEKPKFPEPFGIGSYVFASVRYWDGYENYSEGGYDDDVLPGDEFDGSQLRPAVLKYYEDYDRYDGDNDYTEIDRDDYDDYDKDWDEKYLPGRWRAMSFGRKDTKRNDGYWDSGIWYRRGLILFMRIPDGNE